MVRSYNRKELLGALRQLADELGRVPTTDDVASSEKTPSIRPYYRQFDSFPDAIEEAGMDHVQFKYSDEELLDLLYNLYQEIGKAPTSVDVKQDDGLPDPTTYFKRFDDWKTALRRADIITESARTNGSGRYVEKHSEDEVIVLFRKCKEEHGKVTRDLILSEYDINRAIIEEHFGTFSEAKRTAIDDGKYMRLTQEELTEIDNCLARDDEISEIVTGLLLGDGTIDCSRGNGVLRVGMINQPFLEWLDGQFTQMSQGVRLKANAEDSARNARISGFRPEANSDNYNDFYELTTRRLPYFTELREKWYPNGEKRFPEDIKLTSKSAKMWYCGDGGVNIAHGYVEIRCRTERRRGDFLEGLFEEVGFSPAYQEERLHFRGESEEFLEWLGESPPGFDYKWELDDKERYSQLMTDVYG